MKGQTPCFQLKGTIHDSSFAASPHNASDNNSGDKHYGSLREVDEEGRKKGGSVENGHSDACKCDDEDENEDEIIRQKFLKLACKMVSRGGLSVKQSGNHNKSQASALPHLVKKNTANKIKRKKSLGKRDTLQDTPRGCHKTTNAAAVSKGGGHKPNERGSVLEGYEQQTSSKAAESKARRRCSRRSCHLGHLHNSPYLRHLAIKTPCKHPTELNRKNADRIKNNNNSSSGGGAGGTGGGKWDGSRKTPLCRTLTLDELILSSSTIHDSDKSFSASSNASFGSTGSSGTSSSGGARSGLLDKQNDSVKDGPVAYQLINLGCFPILPKNKY